MREYEGSLKNYVIKFPLVKNMSPQFITVLSALESINKKQKLETKKVLHKLPILIRLS